MAARFAPYVTSEMRRYNYAIVNNSAGPGGAPPPNDIWCILHGLKNASGESIILSAHSRLTKNMFVFGCDFVITY